MPTLLQVPGTRFLEVLWGPGTVAHPSRNNPPQWPKATEGWLAAAAAPVPAGLELAVCMQPGGSGPARTRTVVLGVLMSTYYLSDYCTGYLCSLKKNFFLKILFIYS